MSDYTPNHAEIAAWLNSDMLRDVVERVADRIFERAIVLSPIGTEAEGDEHPGEYISSWKRRTHLFGGINHDRVESIVYNDAHDALWVEFGHYGREPYHVLLRAATGVTI